MPSLSSLALSWRSGAGPSPRPTVSNGHAKLWPELHVGDSSSLLRLCSEKPGVTLGLQSHPALSPIDVPRGVRCTGCSIQQPAGEGAPPLPSPAILGLLRVKTIPPAPGPLSRPQARSMHASACSGSWGRVCVPPFPQLCSCPVTVTTVRAAFSHGHLPLPLHQRSWYNQLPIL